MGGKGGRCVAGDAASEDRQEGTRRGARVLLLQSCPCKEYPDRKKSVNEKISTDEAECPKKESGGNWGEKKKKEKKGTEGRNE